MDKITELTTDKYWHYKQAGQLPQTNRSLVSIRVTKNIFAHNHRHGRPCKNFPVIWFNHHAKFGCCASSVQPQVGPKNWELGGGALQSRPLETAVAAEAPRITLSITCYRTEYGRSRSKQSQRKQGFQKIVETLAWVPGPFGWSVARPQKHAPPPLVLSCRICSFQLKQYYRNYGDPPEKIDHRVPFHGHSRSLELTRIDRLPMTLYY